MLQYVVLIDKAREKKSHTQIKKKTNLKQKKKTKKNKKKEQFTMFCTEVSKKKKKRVKKKIQCKKEFYSLNENDERVD